MGLLRRDTLDGHCVIIAETRAERPDEFAAAPGLAQRMSGPQHEDNCPFCAGNEAATPPTLWERLDSEGRWQVRVVANQFPAVHGMLDVAAPPALATDGDSQFAREEIAAHGVQEIVIESPRHVHWTGELAEHELTGVLLAYRDRLRHWMSDSRLRYGLAFKNVGPTAGATLSHLHGQVLALPFIPPRVAAHLERFRSAAAELGGCPLCVRMEEERLAAARCVAEQDSWFAFCPFASRQPYETWIVPTNHTCHFADTADSEIESLAAIFQRLVSAIETILPNAGYNIVVRTAPFDTPRGDLYHWVLELLPRVTRSAGLEWGSGMHVNPVSPERAAQILKSAKF